MAKHMDQDALDRERVSAVAVRLINLAWFRVGSDRYVKSSKTFDVTTLTKKHVSVRGNKIVFSFHGKHKMRVRTQVADAELAESIQKLLRLRGGRRLFRYRTRATSTT